MPSQIYAWEGPGLNVDLTHQHRGANAVRAKVVRTHGPLAAKAETDGDIHIDASRCDWR